MSIKYKHVSETTVLKPGSARAAPIASARDRAMAKLLAQDNTTTIQAKTQAFIPTQAPSTGASAAQITDLPGVSPIPPSVQSKQSDTNVGTPESSSEGLSQAVDGSESATSPESSSSEQSASNEPATPASPLSSQYAILARKEKALRAKVQAQEQQLREREQAIKAREESFSTTSQQSKSDFISKDQLLADPFSVLSELGLSYDQLTQLAINAPKQEDIARQQYERKLEAEIKSIREEQEKTKKAYEDQQTQAYKQTLSNLHNEVRGLVTADPSFETIKATNSTQDVVDLMERTFNQEGILMSVQEAAEEVENYLVEEALKIARLGKIQSRLAPKPSAPKPATTTTTQQQQSSQQQIRTLTNSVNSTAQKLSPRDRAMAMWEKTSKR